MYLLENLKKGTEIRYTIEDRGQTFEVKTNVFSIFGNRVLLLDGHTIYAF
jgi:hypothetical protein